MVKSIRGRLQIWYALVLILVITGFAGILYLGSRSARYREIDSQLESSAQYLDASLRGIPPHIIEPGRPEPPFMKKGGREGPSKGGKDGGPMRKTPEQFLAELTLPPGSDSMNGNHRGQIYFAVWRGDGSLLKAVGMPDDVEMPPLSTEITQHGDRRELMLRGARDTMLLVGRSIRHERAEMREFAWQLAGVGLAVLSIGLTGGWWISSRIFRPIAAMTLTASKISAAHMSDRIDSESVDVELADLARVLNAAFDRLQEAFERQTQFTADASHELRTPLAIIRSHAQLSLERARQPEEYRKTLEICLRSSDRMTSIVERLLTLARIEKGNSEFHWQRLKWHTLIEETVDQFRPLAAGREITITTQLSEVEVEGDMHALTQVCANLLSNAIYYNRPQGSIIVQLKCLERVALLTISDTGSGIPEEDQPHIFERFYRVDKARSRASGGTGLGLAISKEIVEAHSGTIGFESKISEGSSFWVCLPRSKGID